MTERASQTPLMGNEAPLMEILRRSRTIMRMISWGHYCPVLVHLFVGLVSSEFWLQKLVKRREWSPTVKPHLLPSPLRAKVMTLNVKTMHLHHKLQFLQGRMRTWSNSSMTVN